MCAENSITTKIKQKSGADPEHLLVLKALQDLVHSRLPLNFKALWA